MQGRMLWSQPQGNAAEEEVLNSRPNGFHTQRSSALAKDPLSPLVKKQLQIPSIQGLKDES